MKFRRSDTKSITKMLSQATLFLLGATSLSCLTSASKILFFNGLASYSHLAAMEPLANALAIAGHNVTYLTPMLTNTRHPNVHHFCPKSVLELQGDLQEGASVIIKSRIANKYNNYYFQSDYLWDGNFEICKMYYQSEEFKEWIRNSEFDLIIIDSSAKECGLPLTYIFKAKLILFSPHTLLQFDADTHGWPADSSGVLPFDQDPYLSDSFVNELDALVWYFWKIWKFAPKFRDLVRREMNLPNMPSIVDLEKQAALILANNHFSYEFTRSLPPFVVPVGGIHCKNSDGLKDEALKTFIEDKTAEGFIYVSFGSFMQISALPQEYLEVFLDTFRSFPGLNFVWKWEKEAPANLPSNVIVRNWLPQNDLLAHPKCRGYIMQGGLMSLQQSIFHAVPVIIIPFAGDQPVNARMTAMNGNGIQLEISQLNVASFTSAIQELVHSDRYSNQAKKMSKHFKDRPMHPLNTAIWWTEYVLRNDDFERLRPEAGNHYWWERRMLHFWGLMFTIAAGVSFFVIFVLTEVCKGIFMLLRRKNLETHLKKKRK